eukprot:jgi/Tetstr1/429695/TSEL_019590.t1
MRGGASDVEQEEPQSRRAAGLLAGFAALAFAAATALWAGHASALAAAPHSCAMSYMRPHYAAVRLRATGRWPLSKYQLYLYSEGRPARVSPTGDPVPIQGRPVLFLPGSAGSYKQVRSLASETTQQSDQARAQARRYRKTPSGPLAWYTIDFGEELSALDGALLEHQAAFAVLCLRHLLGTGGEAGQLPILVGHSMGGLVARRAIHQLSGSGGILPALALITLATPHVRPVLPYSLPLLQFYARLEREAQVGVPVISLAAGPRDIMVPTALTLLPEGGGLSLELTATRGVWVSADHQAIAWCNQLVRRLGAVILEMDKAVEPESAAALAKAALQHGAHPRLARNGEASCGGGLPKAPQQHVAVAEWELSSRELEGNGGAMFWWDLHEAEVTLRVGDTEPCVGFRAWLLEAGSEGKGAGGALDASAAATREVTSSAVLVPGRVVQRAPRSAAEHGGTQVGDAWFLHSEPLLGAAPQGRRWRLLLWLENPHPQFAIEAVARSAPRSPETERPLLTLPVWSHQRLSALPAGTPTRLQLGGCVWLRLAGCHWHWLPLWLTVTAYDATLEVDGCWSPALAVPGRPLRPVGPAGVRLNPDADEWELYTDPRCSYTVRVAPCLFEPAAEAAQSALPHAGALAAAQLLAAAARGRGASATAALAEALAAPPLLFLHTAAMLGTSVRTSGQSASAIAAVAAAILLWLLAGLLALLAAGLAAVLGVLLARPPMCSAHSSGATAAPLSVVAGRLCTAVWLGSAACLHPFLIYATALTVHVSTTQTTAALASKSAKQPCASLQGGMLALAAIGSAPAFGAWLALPGGSRHAPSTAEVVLALPVAVASVVRRYASEASRAHGAALGTAAGAGWQEGALASVASLSCIAAFALSKAHWLWAILCAHSVITVAASSWDTHRAAKQE